MRSARPLVASLLAALALLAFACGRPPARTAPRAVPTPTPVPAPTPTPEPTPLPASLPEPEQPLEPPALPLPPQAAGADLILRVGLLSDQTSVTFPCCAATLRAVWEGQTWAITRALRVEPAPEGTEPGVFRIQVTALRDPGQADALAASLRRAAGLPADSVLEAASGLYRVRVGRYATREEAETARRDLSRFGVADAWVVSEGGGVREPALRLVQANLPVTVPGRWVALEESAGAGILVGGHRYRGRILVYLNDRGTLNVIDEVPLEEYLRGVVPRELGPAAYPEVEALKAQAVAARTYAARNLGEFRQEGFDICATPRCQVYGGMDDEHPRSDAAIAATRGEVLLFAEQPIDALFSSTCGGHTENVEVIFPLKQNEPYLRGVPCLEAGVTALGGTAAGTVFPAALVATLVPPARGAGARVDAAAYGERLLALARFAGLAPAPRTLASLDPRDVRRFVAAAFDLALDARLFVAAEDLPYLVQSPPSGWTEEDRRLAALFVKSGLGASAPLPLSAADGEELLYRLALYLRLLREEEVDYFRLENGTLRLRSGDKTREVPLPPRLATYRKLGDDVLAADVLGADLSLLPGDHLRLIWQGESAARHRAGGARPGRRLRPRQPLDHLAALQDRPRARDARQAALPGLPLRQLRGGVARRLRPRRRATPARQRRPPRARRRAGRTLDARLARHALHRQASRAGARRAGLAVQRPRLGAWRRPLPGGRLRHGRARPRLPRHPRPLLHRHAPGRAAAGFGGGERGVARSDVAGRRARRRPLSDHARRIAGIVIRHRAPAASGVGAGSSFAALSFRSEWVEYGSLSPSEIS